MMLRTSILEGSNRRNSTGRGEPMRVEVRTCKREGNRITNTDTGKKLTRQYEKTSLYFRLLICMPQYQKKVIQKALQKKDKRAV